MGAIILGGQVTPEERIRNIAKEEIDLSYDYKIPYYQESGFIAPGSSYQVILPYGRTLEKLPKKVILFTWNTSAIPFGFGPNGVEMWWEITKEKGLNEFSLFSQAHKSYKNASEDYSKMHFSYLANCNARSRDWGNYGIWNQLNAGAFYRCYPNNGILGSHKSEWNINRLIVNFDYLSYGLSSVSFGINNDSSSDISCDIDIQLMGLIYL